MAVEVVALVGPGRADAEAFHVRSLETGESIVLVSAWTEGESELAGEVRAGLGIRRPRRRRRASA